MAVFTLQITVILLFCAFVFLDIVSIASRISGALVKRNALGYSLLVMVNTIKRILIVSYPPVIGLISYAGAPEDVIRVVYYCYAISIIPLFLAYIARHYILTSFAIYIMHYSRSGDMKKSLQCAFRHRRPFWQRMSKRVKNTFLVEGKVSFRGQIDRKLLIMAIWVSVFYTSALFLINIVGSMFSSYGAILYQLVGLVNAFGTLVLAFFLDPRLSRMLDNNGDLRSIYFTLVLASTISFVIAGPLFITAFLFFVSMI